MRSLTLVEGPEGALYYRGEINPIAEGIHFRDTNLDRLLPFVPRGARDLVRAAVAEARDRERVVQKFRTLALDASIIRPSKTLALCDNDVTISGWGTHADALTALAEGQSLVMDETRIDHVRAYVMQHREGLKHLGYETANFVFDPADMRGAYYHSHAEKQALIGALHRLRDEARDKQTEALLSLGVSRPVCAVDCFKFFRAVAQLRSETIVLADPEQVLIFLGNGVILQRLPRHIP